MAQPSQADLHNRLLRRMSAEDFALLAPHLKACEEPRGRTLFEADQPTDRVWFLESGIASMVAISPEQLRAEAGVIGREGFFPISAALGSDSSPYEGVIQVPDDCHSIGLPAFRDAIGRSRSLHGLLLRFVQVMSSQMAFTALSNAVHAIDERLARWLLMCDDRVAGSELPLTHEFMSVMLTVRRPSVTTSLHVLEGNGFIRAERGCIIIRNRAALEAFAGDAYGKPEAEYERLIGAFR